MDMMWLNRVGGLHSDQSIFYTMGGMG